MGCYLVIPLLVRQSADVGLAGLLVCVLVLEAGEGVVEEEADAEEQP